MIPSAGIFSPPPAQNKKYMINYFITLFGIITGSLPEKFSRAGTKTQIWPKHGDCMLQVVILHYAIKSIAVWAPAKFLNRGT